MGKAANLVCLAKYSPMGDGTADGFVGMVRISMDWVADSQRGLAKTYLVVGLGSVDLRLAILDFQSINALSATDISSSSDLRRLGGNPNF